MNKLSSPGPDGFGPSFFTTFWDVVSPDIIAMFDSFYDGTIDLSRINRAFLVLLPKTDVALHPSLFRPNSLQNCVMKAITKVLTSRLQEAIHSMVDDDQTGFLPGRRISENIVYAADLLRCCHLRKAPTLVFKIDFRKAFDSVNWSSLIAKARGFDDRWCEWMNHILATGHTAILLNGVPGCWIRCRNGLHQGDPLSPYLFIIVANVLQRMIRLAWQDGSLAHPLSAEVPCPVLQVTILDGRSKSFWLDKWLPGEPLATRFPTLFSHSTRRHATVATVGGGGLDLQPRLTSAATDELRLVYCIIASYTLWAGCDLRTIDSPSTPRFCSREAYMALAPPRPHDASACISWRLRIPSKIRIFAYLADIDRLSTRANLFRKSCAPSDLCAACTSPDTGRHLFFDCCMAAVIWTRLDVPIPDEEFSVWDLPTPLPFGTDVWRICVAAILWAIWKSRNDLVFNGVIHTTGSTLRRVGDDLSLWRWRLRPPDRARLDEL
ncbi:uncharacterized protein [Lolium perenne]|uniref:uncharacterized protein n=1 Tax=Lolium perenne TaxID=4522 RepID=UPI003A997EB3